MIIEHHLHVGDSINEYHTNIDGYGYVVARRSDVGESIAVAAAVRTIIDDAIIRES